MRNKIDKLLTAYDERRISRRQLIGALLMGVGGVVALGCTVGQGLSGLSTLSLGSFIALASIMGGAVLALRYQIWRVERSA